MLNIIKHNIRPSMNERTHFFIKNISLTLYSRKGDVSCVWGMSCRRRPIVILTQSSSFDHSSTFSSSWLGCSTVGYWGLKALCLLLVLTTVHLLIDGSVESQYVTSFLSVLVWEIVIVGTGDWTRLLQCCNLSRRETSTQQKVVAGI